MGQDFPPDTWPRLIPSIAKNALSTQEHYYVHEDINPTRVIPCGPDPFN